MQIVQRILSKIVGEQISVEEQEMVSGGIPQCEVMITRRPTGGLMCDDDVYPTC